MTLREAVDRMLAVADAIEAGARLPPRASVCRSRLPVEVPPPATRTAVILLRTAAGFAGLVAAMTLLLATVAPLLRPAAGPRIAEAPAAALDAVSGRH